jgi:radical SAM protein with 4Fe4S-binding SPASM domain
MSDVVTTPIADLSRAVLLQKRSVRRRLLEAMPESVGISLDGYSPETYEHVRAGSRWETVRNAIRSFVKERDEMGLTDQIRLHVTSVSPGYTSEIAEKADRFLSETGLPFQFIGLDTLHGAEFLSSDGSIKDYAPQPLPRVKDREPSCWEPIEKMQILWDGTVSACCNVPNGEIRLGHISDGVDAVWQSDAYCRLQRAHLEHALADHDICRKCLGLDIGAPAL